LEDRPINRIVGTITHLGQHLIAIVNEREAYRPSRCPHCGRTGLWCHGHYDRKADRSAGGELNPVPVPRYFCGGCEHTCSRLPACLAPRRWYHWFMQQAVLVLLLSGASMHECTRQTGRSRSTVRRWWRWGELAGFLKARVNESVWPFNDLHYLYGLARAGETDAAHAKLARLQADAHQVDPYIRRTWREVTVPAARGLVAAGLGQHAQAVRELKPVMARMQEVGGSHAQRDLFDLIYLDALEQAGEIPRARALVEKRIVDRRNIAWQHQLLARLH